MVDVVLVNRRGGRRLGDSGSRGGGSLGVSHRRRGCPGVGVMVVVVVLV